MITGRRVAAVTGEAPGSEAIDQESFTVVPGIIVTEETEQGFGLSDPAVRRAREEAIPMGRLGHPEDVADAVILLLADESRYITDQKVVVDGGQNMW
jgi:3-oxoacyl-[acyl-carrier protein] reductase